MQLQTKLIVPSPIQTYGGRGVFKDGLNPRHHAIIYSNPEDNAPSPQERAKGVDALMLTPIRVTTDVPTDRLDPMSRISYSEMYTVQYNTKVKPVGLIHPRSTFMFDRDAAIVQGSSTFPLLGATLAAQIAQATQGLASMSALAAAVGGANNDDVEEEEDDDDDEEEEEDEGEDEDEDGDDDGDDDDDADENGR